jgi:enamine deaminase RidA (YjgF/YER057c/UK114 family)
MSDPIVAGGHLRIRPFNTADRYPEQRLDNDLCQAVVAGHTIYLRGQVPQDLDTGESVHIGNPAAQAGQVMTNIETLLAEAGASIAHLVSCTVYLTDIRLQAGLAAGGEVTPVRSAGIVVAEAVPWPVTDLRVDWHEDPVGQLAGLWQIWRPQAGPYVRRALHPSETAGLPGPPGGGGPG